jgi:hypothetical protein
MSKEIDYEKLKEEARRFGISSFLHIKRFINYKVPRKNQEHCCITCNNRCTITYKNNDVRSQCQIIGCDIDHNADVQFNGICDIYSDVFSK